MGFGTIGLIKQYITKLLIGHELAHGKMRKEMKRIQILEVKLFASSKKKPFYKNVGIEIIGVLIKHFFLCSSLLYQKWFDQMHFRKQWKSKWCRLISCNTRSY